VAPVSGWDCGRNRSRAGASRAHHGAPEGYRLFQAISHSPRIPDIRLAEWSGFRARVLARQRPGYRLTNTPNSERRRLRDNDRPRAVKAWSMGRSDRGGEEAEWCRLIEFPRPFGISSTGGGNVDCSCRSLERTSLPPLFRWPSAGDLLLRSPPSRIKAGR